MEAALDLDIVLPPNDKNQFTALNRVSDTALSLASDIVTADPLRFPDFTDLTGERVFSDDRSPGGHPCPTLPTIQFRALS
jgi:hypothetical protein